MLSTIKNFINDESGATAIEYGLIAAGIAVAVITVVGQLGEQVKGAFEKVKDAIATEVGS